jgi:CBS domain-containing membrane protein
LQLSHQSLSSWFLTFKPMPIVASRREKLLSCVGALIGLMLTEYISRWALGSLSPWFIAPMGASAVLLFAVPASPLAQPWSIIGGNTSAAIIGVSCAIMIPDRGIAAGVSVSLAIGAMFFLRCLHPPSGAVALTAVLGGPAIQELGYSFVLFPVAINSFAIMLLAVMINVLFRRKYPHSQTPPASIHQTKDLIPSERIGFKLADLEAVLKERGELLDVGALDLAGILSQAEVLAHRRRFGDVRCFDIMSKDVVVTQRSHTAQHAWQLMMKHKIKALPVVNDAFELEGILTLHDFLVSKDKGDMALGPTRFHGVSLVEEHMTVAVVKASPDQPLAELVSLFSDGGLHHIPVTNQANKLLGIITQSDMVAALFQNQIHQFSIV